MVCKISAWFPELADEPPDWGHCQTDDAANCLGAVGSFAFVAALKVSVPSRGRCSDLLLNRRGWGRNG
jgi:hypothetical protein